MSLVCEISGEPVVGKDEAVVTPSGHVCLKRLLLTKLMENGGMDPFEDKRPLSEEQLVTLNTTASVAKPKPSAMSMPSMLQTMQNEYDALVLELFDTRKALEETRRELSQALYQNDAAIRVVARVSQERDTFQQQLEQWKASASASASAAAPAASVAEEEPSASPNKRRRIETTEVLENDLPEQDIAKMSEVWAQLNKVRKPTLKAAASEAPSPETVAKMTFLNQKAWHKSTNKGIPCLASSISDGLTVTAGKDKQLVVYDETNKVVKHTFALKAVATAAAIGKGLVVAGTKSGNICAYFLSSSDEPTSSTIAVKSAIVNVGVHPTGEHVVASTSDGRVIVCIAQDGHLQQVASFSAPSKETYTSAALHPDGLIYVAGTSTGKLHVWDFKNKALAATLQVSSIVREMFVLVMQPEKRKSHFFSFSICRRETRRTLSLRLPFPATDITLVSDTHRRRLNFGI